MSSGFRSLLVFWIGGASNPTGIPTPTPTIAIASGGSGRKRKRGLQQEDIIKLLDDYKLAHETVSLPPEIRKEIVAAVKPFVIKTEQRDGMLSEHQAQDSTIDIAKLVENSKSLQRLEEAIRHYKLWEEEEFAIIALLAFN